MSAYQKFFSLILTLALIGPAVFSAGSAAGAKAENIFDGSDSGESADSAEV